VPEKVIHGTAIEITCPVAPSLVLVSIAIPSFALLYSMDEVVHFNETTCDCGSLLSCHRLLCF